MPVPDSRDSAFPSRAPANKTGSSELRQAIENTNPTFQGRNSSRLAQRARLKESRLFLADGSPEVHLELPSRDPALGRQPARNTWRGRNRRIDARLSQERCSPSKPLTPCPR